MKSTLQRVALASVLGLGLVATAAAQDRAPDPGGPQGLRGADRQNQVEDRQHRLEQRLHDLLQIKPDQEPAFRTFVSTLEQSRPQRGQRRDGARDRAQGEREALTMPQQLDRAAQRLADAQQRLQKEAAAVKTFYAALSPDQRKALDAAGGEVLGRDRGFGRRGGFMRSRFEGPPIR